MKIDNPSLLEVIMEGFFKFSLLFCFVNANVQTDIDYYPIRELVLSVHCTVQ